MDNLPKMYKILTVIAVVVAVAVFIVKTESASAASLQTSKPTNTSVKAVRKRIITPNQARNFLNDFDMPTRDYEMTGEVGYYGKYEARSDYLLLETRDPNRYINNLTYYVSGDKFVAKAVELELNVNDLSYKANAIAALIKYSNGLIYKVTGEKLTPEIKRAIQTQTNGNWTINGYKIKLAKELFPDERIVKGVEPSSDHGAFSLTFLIEL